MKLGTPELLTKGDRTHVTATVLWENCDRPPQEIYFETTQAFADGVSRSPHAILTACNMPAMRHGEVRIAMDAAICPELRNGLLTAMSWIRHWFGPERELMRIEAKASVGLSKPSIPARAGLFMSGGIDSVSALRANRLDFPLEHPGSFKDGLLIHGIEKGKSSEQFQQGFAAVSKIAQDAGIDLIPVYTNIRQLDDDSDFWGHQFQGAALSTVAHAFSRRLTAVSIPATYDLRGLIPYSSHPLLDPQYSTVTIGNRAARKYQESCYRDTATALSKNGHHDLARRVDRLIARSHATQRMKHNRNRLKLIDHKFLKGGIAKLCGAIS